MIRVFIWHTMIGVDGCPWWSESLIGTQWSVWTAAQDDQRLCLAQSDRSGRLPRMIRVFIWYTMISVDGCPGWSETLFGTQWSGWTAAQDDPSLYLVHNDQSWRLPRMIRVFVWHTVIGVDGCTGWSESLFGTQWSEWTAAQDDPSLYLVHSDQCGRLPRMILFFIWHTMIGVDGCLGWSESLFGTQWSEWTAAQDDPSLYLVHNDQSGRLPRLIRVFVWHTVIGVDGCPGWSESLFGTQWSEWTATQDDPSLYLAHSDQSEQLSMMIRVFVWHTVIGMDGCPGWSESLFGTQWSEWSQWTAAQDDQSLYLAHSDQCGRLPRIIRVFIWHTVIGVDGCRGWSESLFGTQWSEWTSA